MCLLREDVLKKQESKAKEFDAIKMRNINIMEEMSVLRPSSWIEWDTWTGADAPDCDDNDNGNDD